MFDSMICRLFPQMKKLFNRLIKKDTVDQDSGLSENHEPPKKNFGTLDENIDESGNINP